MQFLFRPTKGSLISQKFGANNACVNLNDSSDVIGCDGLNPPSGYRSVYSNIFGHNGLDFTAMSGQSIFSSCDGTVIEEVTELERGYGLGIVTDKKYLCKETGKEEYFKIRYWHNKVHFVHVGDKVTLGQVIALADNTGYSTGNHLHFEIKPVKEKRGKWVNVLQNNGFLGAVDPQPYLLPHQFNGSIFEGTKDKFSRLLAILKLI